MKTLLIILLSLSTCCKKCTSPKEVKSAEIEVSVIHEIQSKEQKLKNKIIEVIKYYNEKDEKAINKLIHSKTGVYILYRNGPLDVWEQIDSIHFNTKWEDNIKIPYWIKGQINNQRIQTDNEIKESNSKILISCDSIREEGLFIVKDVSTKNLLSNIIKDYINFLKIEGILSHENQKELNNKIIEVLNWEENSVRIIISKKSEDFYGNIFVFYLTYLDNEWWITIADYASMDCSV